MKPAGEVFDRTWRQACRLEPCPVKEVDRFIRAHYLAKRPAIVMAAFRVMFRDDPVGCVVYSAPPRETSKRYGGPTLELARLYLLDSVPTNAETWAIAQSVRLVRRLHPEVRFLVSYADPSVGHAGTIYRAANWIPDGRTDGERKRPRCDYMDLETGKKYGRRGNVPAGARVVRVPRVSKWRFVLPLGP